MRSRSLFSAFLRNAATQVLFDRDLQEQVARPQRQDEPHTMTRRRRKSSRRFSVLGIIDAHNKTRVLIKEKAPLSLTDVHQRLRNAAWRRNHAKEAQSQV